MLAEGARRGHPRHAAATPFEYEPAAKVALPGTEAYVVALTDDYVAARYGQIEPDAAALARLRAAWERIRAERRPEEGELTQGWPPSPPWTGGR